LAIRAVLVVLLSSLVLGTAARCGEPGTRVVIFVQGIYTTLDEDGTQTSFAEDHRFETLKEAFVAAEYKPEQLLDYSYNGGDVDRDGVWTPEPYECAITDRPIIDSVQLLEKMVRDYRKEHPDAHVTLVGHSLGGYIAFEAGVREAARSKDARIGIDGVVTIDAPLLGVSADKKTIIDLAIPCDKTYLAGAELVVARGDASTPARRAEQARAMAAAGVRLATIGNKNDCLWNTAYCLGGTWIDDSPSQYVEGAEFSKQYEIVSDPLASHDAILIDSAANADVVGFVGNP
jgi:pimeloyl-ACP methyl ester carboxylesterase